MHDFFIAILPKPTRFAVVQFFDESRYVARENRSVADFCSRYAGIEQEKLMTFSCCSRLSRTYDFVYLGTRLYIASNFRTGPNINDRKYANRLGLRMTRNEFYQIYRYSVK